MPSDLARPLLKIDSRQLRLRIMNVLPAASYHMDHFLRLVDVVLSDRSETACVEVGGQPKLHINPNFLYEHCQQDEHLFMLVLHELYHVILGHTRLFPRLSVLHNIAFDAIINSMLCEQFPEAKYFAFFQNINPEDSFPARLLHPPQGWPTSPIPFSEDASAAEKKVIGLLYGKKSRTVTYQEIFDLLRKELEKEELGNYVLLGEHDEKPSSGNAEDKVLKDDLLKGILHRVAGDWPFSKRPLNSRGKGGNPAQFLMPKEKTPKKDFLFALNRLLIKAGILNAQANIAHAWKIVDRSREFTSVLPQWKDRHAASKTILMGYEPILFQTETLCRQPRWNPQNVAHVYLDVSGSMLGDLPWLVSAMDPLHKKGLCRLFAFSTVVAEIKKGKLKTDQFENTYGTDINCVFKHVLSLPKSKTPKRILVLTDGFTGFPSKKLIEDWKEQRGMVFVGLIGKGADGSMLEKHASVIERLPDPKG